MRASKKEAYRSFCRLLTSMCCSIGQIAGWNQSTSNVDCVREFQYMHLAKTKKVLEGSSLPSKRSPLCNLQEHFRKTDSPLATCKNIFQGGFFLLQPARAFSKVEFSSCNLQEHFPRWIFSLATCKSIFGRPICLLQPARAFRRGPNPMCNLDL